MEPVYFAYAFIGIACCGILYVLGRAAGLIRFGEKPQRILGKRIKFLGVDGIAGEVVDLPMAMVKGFEDGRYDVEFVEPCQVAGASSRRAEISARHVGFPVSRLGCAVNGVLDTGQAFIAWVRAR